MTNQEIIRAAQSEQGGDSFPGVDRYRVKALPPGTRLVKLEPSSSGFFIPWEVYRRYMRDSKCLSEVYQISPWKNKGNSKHTFEHIYRQDASLFVTTREIKVAEGISKQNVQYGKGGEVQYHLSGYKRGNESINSSLGVKKNNLLSLRNFGLDVHSAQIIELKRDFYVNNRNYHAYLAQTEELKRLRDQLTIPGHVKKCNERLVELEKTTKVYQDRIQRNLAQFKQLYPELSMPSAPSYEKVVRYQERLAAAPEKRAELLNPRLERESQALKAHLIAKVDQTARKVISGEWKPGECDREIKVDEIRKVYETDQFVKRAQCLKQMADGNARVNQLEQAIAQIDNREKELLRMGKLSHVLDDQRPSLQGELNQIKARQQTLRGELSSLDKRLCDYQHFLAMSGKATELTGPSLRF